MGEGRAGGVGGAGGGERYDAWVGVVEGGEAGGNEL